MTDQISSITTAGVASIAAAETSAALAEIEADLLGRSSELAQLRAGLKDVDPSERKTLGRQIHEGWQAIETAIADRRTVLEDAEMAARLAAERIDLTESLGTVRRGHEHLVTTTWQRLEDVFVGMGFSVADGPEVETDWFNFQALNLPENHPARSMWDTLYVDAGEEMQVMMRTHTSPVQVRSMMRAVAEGSGPPIYVICPGRTYRKETADATHLPVFHQIEGLVIDRGINMGHLNGTLNAFTEAYFGEGLVSRLRPSYFPFTEPSAEFDVSTPDGGWLELGGCGMVHPNVLTACGLDPEEWSGFAFGFGIERLVKIRHELADIRDLMVNDVRFLEQF